MDLKQAKEILNEAINIAVQKGCFNISQVELIIPALTKINGLDDVEFGEITPIEK